MKDFFDNLYEHGTLNEYRNIEIRAIVFGEGVRCNEWISDTSKIEGICKEVNGLHYYFGCASRSPNYGDKEHVRECPFLWTEIDFKETPEKKALQNILDAGKAGFKPTYIIHSGGGYHLYWKLKEPYYINEGNKSKDDIKSWESYLRRLCFAMDGDMQCAEIARILRVPGTHNYKYEHKPMVKILKHYDVEYNLTDIVDCLPPESDIPKKSRSKSDFNWDTEGFIQKAYAGGPYGEGHRNEVVKEVIKYYANNLPPDADVYFHTKMFVDKCVNEGSYGDINGGVYDERDIKRRVQWAVENRRVNKVEYIEHETEKAYLVTMWLPKDRVVIKED